MGTPAAYAQRDHLRIVAQPGGQIPAAEEAHGDARAAGAEHLAPAQGIEDARARVLLGPHAGEAAGIENDPTGIQGSRAERCSAEASSVAAMADETILGHRPRGSVVGVGAGDDAELIRDSHRGAALPAARPAARRARNPAGRRSRRWPTPKVPVPSPQSSNGGVRLFSKPQSSSGAPTIPREPIHALRVALVLEDLHQRLHAGAERRLLALLLQACGAGIFDEEHIAVALVRVVGMARTSQPLPASRQVLCSSLHSPCGVGCSKYVVGDGTCWLRKMTLRCRLLTLVLPVYS